MATVHQLREQRGALVDSQKGLLAQMQHILDGEGEDGLTEEDQKTFDEMEEEVTAIKGSIEALDGKIARRQKVEDELAKHATPALAPTPIASPPGIEPHDSAIKVHPTVAVAKPELPKGIMAAQLIRAIALIRKGGMSFERLPHIMATQIGNEWLAKQLNTGTGADGGFLVPTVLSTEIIEILRAAAVVMAAGPRMLPMPQGNLTIPAGANGAVATYGAEGADITATQQTFREVVLQAKKLSAIIPITNELLNDASGNVDAFIRDDLVTAMAERSDLAFLRGDGTNNTPTGFLNLVNAANTNASTGTTLANITQDLGDAELGLLNNNVPLEGAAWFMAPRSWMALRNIRDGNGNYAFPEAQQGRLRNSPIYATSQIPINLGVGTDESEVYLANMRHVIVGETGTMEMDTSQEASYFDGAELRSAFSRDLTLIRTRWRHDINIRQIFCLSLITAVQWQN